ncbi:GNAT family N-acetyltransferase [Streptomyces spectabilis]|uniref:GNAT family N-acetyltransferase n=1 Tax=Streptomyces spectabilis TaxID=68270 RepID=A0A516R8N1_STRST|nr:GNAT family N-acetyltransferase [Streptomyces spectabilis]QDQ11984.1 GNAT family N-acetyltransferase [Streptomyces spectabilis]
MDLDITTLAERPELAGPRWAMDDSWAEFVGHDLVARSHLNRIPDAFPEYVLLATDGQERVVARAFGVPFALRSDERGGERGELPGGGWDRVPVRAFADLRYGDEPDTVSAIEVAIDPAHQGRGLSGRMLAAMRDNARARGFAEVVAPVRPNAKHLEPSTPIEEYAHRTRADGLPHDPWLRVHVRVGGVIAKVAPTSMTVSGSLAQWREWTGLPFDADEDCLVEVAGALVPVHCAPERGYAVHVEPNVWVRHAL